MEDQITALVRQIIPQAHEQQIKELVSIIISGMVDFTWTTADGDWSDAGCVLQDLVAPEPAGYDFLSEKVRKGEVMSG